MLDVVERFTAKFEKIPIAGCWIWTAAQKEYGYGVFGVPGGRGKVDRAHRVAWKLFRGEIPKSMNVLHRCGVAACVNPDHLYLGTLKENAQDTIRMGRARFPDNRGEKAKWAKLSATDALAIYALKGKVPATELSKRFGVCRGNIHNIWTGKSWSSVTGHG